MVLRRRAEVPEHRVALARKQHAPRALVARPLADVRARDVADVVLVEEENRAQLGVAQRRPRLLQPLAPEPGEVDPLLPIDRHRRAARGDVRGNAHTGHLSLLGLGSADALIELHDERDEVVVSVAALRRLLEERPQLARERKLGASLAGEVEHEVDVLPHHVRRERGRVVVA